MPNNYDAEDLGLDEWYAKVYACCNCNTEFMVDDEYNCNYCPACGKAIYSIRQGKIIIWRFNNGKTDKCND